MRRLLSTLLLVACSPAPSTSAPPVSDTEPAPTRVEPSRDTAECRPVSVPDTPAGRLLQRFVAAANAKDLSVAETFVATELAPAFFEAFPEQQHIGFIRGLNGDQQPVAVCRIESSGSDEVVALLSRVDDDGKLQYGRLLLAVDPVAGKVSSLGMEPATQEDLTRPIATFDAAAKHEAVEAVANGLADYVFADKVQPMAARIRKARDDGAYAEITEPRKLAKRLTEDLRAVTGDKHLHVSYSASVLPPKQGEAEPSAEEIERYKQQAAADNFAMPVAEIRDGNIGYLLVLGFLPPVVSREAVAATMSKIADADALIIDLRQNGGGSPEGVALMSSYLFGKQRVHLNDIYTRRDDRTESFYTSPDAPGKHFGPRKPIFVLVSNGTFSAGEEFAYNLKALKRATIIGETTGGGAHPTDFVRVADHWAVGLPSARAINPITKTNWEGVGVEPHIDVPADRALDKALELARQARRKK